MSSSTTWSRVGVDVWDRTGFVSSATITFDGGVLPLGEGLVQEGYYTAGPYSLTGVHAVTIDVPGYATETLDFTMPAPPELLAPTDGQVLQAGRPVALSWTNSAGAAYYDIFVWGSEGFGHWLFHDVTIEPSAIMPASEYRGGAILVVDAVALPAVGTQGSFVTPIAEDSVTVTFAR